MAHQSASLQTNSEATDLIHEIVEPTLGNTSAQLKTTLAEFLSARVELASIEAKEAASFAARKTIYGVILGICLFFAWSLTLAAITGILAPIATGWIDGQISWLPGWAAVLIGLAVIHGFFALIFLLCLKKKASSPLFELSRQEIENDKQWLKKNK